MRYAFMSFLLVLLVAVAHGEPGRLVVGDFSPLPTDKMLPDRWDPLVFDGIDNHTVYTHVSDGGVGVIRAESVNSSSGLVRKLLIDPESFSHVSWRWKIEDVVAGADLTRKKGDDAPARIYITFAYDAGDVGFFERLKFASIKLFYGEYPPVGALMYVWASQTPKGTILESPYTDRVKLIVLESGAENKGQWQQEQRNVAEDYRQAFGGTQVPEISGVALMTDTDNTGGQATAWYGDIVFLR